MRNPKSPPYIFTACVSHIGKFVSSLILLFLCQTFLSCKLNAAPQYLSRKAAAFVVDANTKEVLHNYLGTELRHPASLTKMMTLYLLFEGIKSKRLSLTSPLLISQKAASVAPSKLGLKPGSLIKVEDAIKALVVKSANDMAVAISENLSGNEVSFARLMTQRAKQIGMENTVFRNASGLPNREQVTTAKDMVILGLRLQNDYPEFYNFFSLKTFVYEGKMFETHNNLLVNFDGVDGIKTGYTRMSGFNIVSSYNAKGKKVVGAVFGGVSAEARDAHMRMLLALAIDKVTSNNQKIINSETQINQKSNEILHHDEPNSSVKRNKEIFPFNKRASIEKEHNDLYSVSQNKNSNFSNLASPERKHSIQIGVFQTLDGAEEALSNAQRHLGDKLSDHPSQTIPMTKAGQFLYIALFTNFGFDSASRACKELQRLKIDCLPVKEP